MNIQEKKLDHGRIELAVTIDPVEVQEWINDWCQKNEAYGGQLLDLLTCDLADKQIQAEAKTALLEYGEYLVLDKRSPTPLTKPILVARSNVSTEKAFGFSIIYIPFPQMGLSSYEPPAFKMSSIKVSSDDIDSRLREMLHELPTAQVKAIGSVVEQGDTVEISMKAVSDGHTYEPLTSSLREYRLGDAFMPKAFEDVLLGMKVGDEASVEIEIPKGQSEVEEDQEYISVVVSVQLLRIMREDIDSLTDEEVGLLFPGMKTVEQLKRGVRQMILDENEQAAGEYKKRRILDILVRRVNGRLTDDIFEAQYDATMGDLDLQLKESGMTLDEFYDMQQTDEQNFRLATMIDIRTQLLQSIALDAFARHKEIEPTDEDRTAFFDMISRMENNDVAREVYEKSYTAAIEESVKRMLVLEGLLEDAKVTIS